MAHAVIAFALGPFDKVATFLAGEALVAVIGAIALSTILLAAFTLVDVYRLPGLAGNAAVLINPVARFTLGVARQAEAKPSQRINNMREPRVAR
jgi:hypothetical protein